MLQNTQTVTTQIEIRESGNLTQAYKRTILKKRLSHVGAASWSLLRWLVIDPWLAVGAEFKHQMKLEVIDMLYHSSLHAQYKAGRRTQVILATKRTYGL